MRSLDYEVRESARVKRMRLSVLPDGSVVVTVPKARSGVVKLLGMQADAAAIERWVDGKRGWIEDAQHAFEKLRERQAKQESRSPRIALPRLRRGTKAYEAAREAARSLATARLEHFNAFYGFMYGAISIRDQKTRWGSCSARNALSFNYRIAQLPPELADYLVVHELCHTKHHNHSAAYWKEVARTLPQHRELRKELKRYRF